MKKSMKALAMLVVLGLVGCSSVQPAVKANPSTTISRYPDTAYLGSLHKGLQTLPSYDENLNENWQVDVRSTDLSTLDLHDRLFDLLHADFDSMTQWPSDLPEGFDPSKIMELGKDPGLNVRDLHKQGITGKGISVAVIDQPLLVDHKEYFDRLKHYEEINIMENSVAQMHGPAVASIAVGKTVGVAPEAELYYIAESHGTYKGRDFEWDFSYLANAIDRVLEINKSLPKEKKIKVISISVGWTPDRKGYQEVTKAVERAKGEGIFVVSTSLGETYRFASMGLGRDSLRDPNDFSSYGPGEFWKDKYFAQADQIKQSILLFPMDARCTASPTGQEDYVFYSRGGMSWSIPYIAGLYALACQVHPNITPQEFWQSALDTGETIDVEKDGRVYLLGKVVNPVKLIKSLQKK